ncbi:hypothetical protein D3C73_1409910 [compost metagenome]
MSSVSPLSVKSTSMIVAKALSFISKADQQPLMITIGKSAKHIVISLFLNLFIPAHLFAATNVANCSFVWYRYELETMDVAAYSTKEHERKYLSFRPLQMA